MINAFVLLLSKVKASYLRLKFPLE